MKKTLLMLIIIIAVLTSCGKKSNLVLENDLSSSITSTNENTTQQSQQQETSPENANLEDISSNSSSTTSPNSKTSIKTSSNPISSSKKNSSENNADSKFKYLKFMPENYQEGATYPLVIFLHGLGECGTDVEKVEDISLPYLAKNGKKYPFYIIAPQIEEGKEWINQVSELNVFLDEILEKYNVDTSRIYLTGNSLGGIGTWEWGCKNPERFAAIIPVCGIGNVKLAKNLINMPIWAFHGERDKRVLHSGTTLMIDAINKLGGNAKQTIYEKVQHNAWDYCYKNKELFDWMLLQKKS